MVKIRTKETASLLIGSMSAVACVVTMIILGEQWWISIIAALGVFVVISLFSLWMIYEYVANKLRPIYSVVLSRNVNTSEILSEMKDTKVEQISESFKKWAVENDTEINRLKDAEKFRKQYLGNVAHELKTPIFNIQGYISTLLEGGLDDELVNRKYLERAEKSVERLINIIGDLDTIARLESGMHEMKNETFDMVALAKDIAEQCDMEAKKHNIHIVVKGSNSLPSRMWVSADKFYIEQVMENLIINSIHYGHENGTTKITCRDMLEKILVEVEDDGIGIAASDVPRVFERFYRTDKGRSREQGGTGLGLAIVKHIIEGHGEHVSVRSELGKGSTFTFTLKKVQL